MLKLHVVFQYEFFIALLEEYLPDKQTMKELLNFKFSHYLDNPEEEVRLQMFSGFQVNKSISYLQRCGSRFIESGYVSESSISSRSVRCSSAQWKDIRPWQPEFGTEGK
jgi:hypothetical protein